jgi:lysophospholipase L1-like esterase
LAATTAAVALAVAPAASANPYVALGDSVAAGGSTYVGKLYPEYQLQLGATQLRNRAQGGASTTSVLNGGQLATALADINDPTDTKAVTIDIGGNDFLSGSCVGDCYRTNLASILGQLKTALDADPGDEPFTVMAYYNPDVGEPAEAERDIGLLGDNLALGCDDAGADVGLNDIINQETARLGLLLANPYAAFKAGGQAYMADSIHPNSTGHDAIAQAFRDAAVPDCSPVEPPSADRTPPETTIIDGPPKRTHKRRATYRFEASDPGSTFECRLDGGGFEQCTPPHKLKGLYRGRHTFRVRAIDAAGNADATPAVDRFRVVKRRR